MPDLPPAPASASAPDPATATAPGPSPAPSPAPLPRPLRPPLRVRRFAIPVGSAIVAAAAFLAGRASLGAPLRPIVISMPAPAPAPAAPAAAPAPALPDEPEPACPSLSEESTPPERWTMSDVHFGPFATCVKTIDRAYVQRVLPGYDVAEVPQPYFPDQHLFQVTRRGRPVLTIWPPGDGPGLRVEVHTRAIETPWRVRVGDRVGTLVAHHRGLACMYGAAEGGEGLWCRRGVSYDGWRDTLQYTIDLRPLGADRSLVRGGIDPSQIAHLRIESIEWQPGTPAP
jgi:hypothetical protein